MKKKFLLISLLFVAVFTTTLVTTVKPAVASESKNGNHIEEIQWKENSKEVENFKKLSLEAYPKKKISVGFTDEYDIQEWKFAEDELKKYVMCNYIYKDKKYSLVMYQDEYENVNIAQLTIDGKKQSKKNIRKCSDEMFKEKKQEEADTESSELVGVQRTVDIYPHPYTDYRVYGENPECPATPTTLEIYDITDTSFMFRIEEYPTGNVIFMDNKAVFTGEGKTATFYGQEYTLNFTFPDAVTINVTGFGPSEGIDYQSNCIPGHQFS